MKVLVYHGPRMMKLEESSEPKPGPGEALIRVQAAGICGSEIEGYLGQNSLRVPPVIMGHEFSGEVAALGSEDISVPRIGQLVTVNPLVPCGNCTFCQAGLVHVCPNRYLIGAHRPGAFADYVVVPLSTIIPLSESTDPTVGALTEPFAVALHGVRLARIAPGDGVVVWGAGNIGLLTICAARLAQPARIIAIDANPARLECANTMGATTVLDARDSDIVARVHKEVADLSRVVVFDAVGRSVTRQNAVAAAGPAGTVVFLGLHDKDTTFDINGVIRSEVTIIGSYAYQPVDIQRAVELLEAGQVPGGPWLEVRDFSAGPDSFAELVDRPGVATKIVLVP